MTARFIQRPTILLLPKELLYIIFSHVPLKNFASDLISVNKAFNTHVKTMHSHLTKDLQQAFMRLVKEDLEYRYCLTEEPVFLVDTPKSKLCTYIDVGYFRKYMSDWQETPSFPAFFEILKKKKKYYSYPGILNRNLAKVAHVDYYRIPIMNTEVRTPVILDRYNRLQFPPVTFVLNNNELNTCSEIREHTYVQDTPFFDDLDFFITNIVHNLTDKTIHELLEK